MKCFEKDIEIVETAEFLAKGVFKRDTVDILNKLDLCFMNFSVWSANLNF